ncbi:MAG: hypothetical protein Q9164_003999, partial [Protoblastenia rupestris]
RKEKGKSTTFDPKRPKKLLIFFAASSPKWQDEYIALIRNNFNTLTLSVDEKTVGETLKAKGGKEMKRAMPFVQSLKKRLHAGEKQEVVFERKLGFEEEAVLAQMVKGLKRTTGCQVIEVVKVEDEGDEGGKKGKVVAGDGEGESRGVLPPVAGSAVPGGPSFHFENV